MAVVNCVLVLREVVGEDAPGSGVDGDAEKRLEASWIGKKYFRSLK